MGQTLSEPVVEKVRLVPLNFMCSSRSTARFYSVFFCFAFGHWDSVLGPGARGAILLSHEPLTQHWRWSPRNTNFTSRAYILSLVGNMQQVQET
jgi:hypothetical protein